ncbi:MAG: M1 family metallopeptidase [Chlorobi bacterium]|nr:M1 family metallopeptidase [Chlorobiota bacterium]
MFKNIFLSITGICITAVITAQIKTADLFMQKEIRNAYEKETRSYDGKPGKNYFVNKTDYTIDAEFNPETKILSGNETINYTNNGTDTLKVMYFNLYQDLYKKGNARDWDIGTSDLTDGVKINKITFNGKKIDTESKQVSNRQSILKIKLPENILPHSQAEIKISWEVKIPEKITIRQGTYEKDNFFIAFWYPKVAVYDDIVGWNTHGHTGSQEFYNDFGNFDVSITLPGDYQVWATGVLQNMNELYNEKYVKLFEKSKQTDEVIHIITEKDRKKGKILKKSDKHTWKFKSEQTPDFAFGVSRTYLWDAASIISGNRRVSVNAVYKPESENFKHVAEILRRTLKFFTEEIPGIPYPYPQITDFNGGGGMEFPGMTNCGETKNLTSTYYLTAHEVGHSYYPFYTGLNEQKYAWMDEGLITFFPQYVIEKYAGDSTFTVFKRNIAVYNKLAGNYNDVPLMISSNNVGRNAYRFHAYNRPSVAFYLLYDYLGKEKFAKVLQLFTGRWHGKHPVPFDLFFAFNEVAGEDLAWFWKPWFFDLGYADLSISGIDTSLKDKFIVTVKNKTGFPVPVYLTAEYKNGETKHFDHKMNVWKHGNKTFRITIPSEELKKVYLDTELTPDAFPEDNVYDF